MGFLRAYKLRNIWYSCFRIINYFNSILNKINAIRNLDTATFISYTYYKSDLALPLIDQSEQIDQLVNIPFGQLLES